MATILPANMARHASGEALWGADHSSGSAAEKAMWSGPRPLSQHRGVVFLPGEDNLTEFSSEAKFEAARAAARVLSLAIIDSAAQPVLKASCASLFASIDAHLRASFDRPHTQNQTLGCSVVYMAANLTDREATGRNLRDHLRETCTPLIVELRPDHNWRPSSLGAVQQQIVQQIIEIESSIRAAAYSHALSLAGSEDIDSTESFEGPGAATDSLRAGKAGIQALTASALALSFRGECRSMLMRLVGNVQADFSDALRALYQNHVSAREFVFREVDAAQRRPSTIAPPVAVSEDAACSTYVDNIIGMLEDAWFQPTHAGSAVDEAEPTFHRSRRLPVVVVLHDADFVDPRLLEQLIVGLREAGHDRSFGVGETAPGVASRGSAPVFLIMTVSASRDVFQRNLSDTAVAALSMRPAHMSRPEYLMQALRESLFVRGQLPLRLPLRVFEMLQERVRLYTNHGHAYLDGFKMAVNLHFSPAWRNAAACRRVPASAGAIKGGGEVSGIAPAPDVKHSRHVPEAPVFLWADCEGKLAWPAQTLEKLSVVSSAIRERELAASGFSPHESSYLSWLSQPLEWLALQFMRPGYLRYAPFHGASPTAAVCHFDDSFVFSNNFRQWRASVAAAAADAAALHRDCRDLQEHLLRRAGPVPVIEAGVPFPPTSSAGSAASPCSPDPPTSTDIPRFWDTPLFGLCTHVAAFAHPRHLRVIWRLPSVQRILEKARAWIAESRKHASSTQRRAPGSSAASASASISTQAAIISAIDVFSIALRRQRLTFLPSGAVDDGSEARDVEDPLYHARLLAWYDFMRRTDMVRAATDSSSDPPPAESRLGQCYCCYIPEPAAASSAEATGGNTAAAAVAASASGTVQGKRHSSAATGAISDRYDAVGSSPWTESVMEGDLKRRWQQLASDEKAHMLPLGHLPLVWSTDLPQHYWFFRRTHAEHYSGLQPLLRFRPIYKAGVSLGLGMSPQPSLPHVPSSRAASVEYFVLGKRWRLDNPTPHSRFSVDYEVDDANALPKVLLAHLLFGLTSHRLGWLQAASTLLLLPTRSVREEVQPGAKVSAGIEGDAAAGAHEPVDGEAPGASPLHWPSASSVPHSTAVLDLYGVSLESTRSVANDPDIVARLQIIRTLTAHELQSVLQRTRSVLSRDDATSTWSAVLPSRTLFAHVLSTLDVMIQRVHGLQSAPQAPTAVAPATLVGMTRPVSRNANKAALSAAIAGSPALAAFKEDVVGWFKQLMQKHLPPMSSVPLFEINTLGALDGQAPGAAELPEELPSSPHFGVLPRTRVAILRKLWYPSVRGDMLDQLSLPERYLDTRGPASTSALNPLRISRRQPAVCIAYKLLDRDFKGAAEVPVAAWCAAFVMVFERHIRAAADGVDASDSDDSDGGGAPDTAAAAVDATGASVRKSAVPEATGRQLVVGVGGSRRRSRGRRAKSFQLPLRVEELAPPEGEGDEEEEKERGSTRAAADAFDFDDDEDAGAMMLQGGRVPFVGSVEPAAPPLVKRSRGSRPHGAGASASPPSSKERAGQRPQRPQQQHPRPRRGGPAAAQAAYQALVARFSAAVAELARLRVVRLPEHRGGGALAVRVVFDDAALWGRPMDARAAPAAAGRA